MKKKIVFLSATRADYGKLKNIIHKIQGDKKFDTKVIVTGMHLMKFYGYTYKELIKDKVKNLVFFKNQNMNTRPDKILQNTINKISDFIKMNKPDLMIIHGDRIEPLAASIVSLLNNIKVCHIEGGEVSGTQDEIIRHSITKLSHFHFVTNKKAKNRILQMGEKKSSIFVIGSPDMDLIFSKDLPSLSKVKKKYNINFDRYSIGMLHPVTTLYDKQKKNAQIFFNTLKKSKRNYIIFFPNNDIGSNFIYEKLKEFKKFKNFKIFPSMRFEYFLTLLKNSNFMIGNSSAGIMEAPYYGVPTINIGNRQQNRSKNYNIINIDFEERSILKAINSLDKIKRRKSFSFGKGKSAEKFFKIINSKQFWSASFQKYFIDRKLFRYEIFR